MRRRDVVRLAAAAAALPATRPWELRAQPTRIRLIGFLGATSLPAVSGTLLPALRRGVEQTDSAKAAMSRSSMFGRRGVMSASQPSPPPS